MEVRAGREVVAAPQAAAELEVETWAEGGARAAPRAAAWEGARRAWAELRGVAPEPRALPSKVQWSVEGSRSIRRIYFPEEKICDTSGT